MSGLSPRRARLEPLESRRLLASISGTIKQDSNGDGNGDSWTTGAAAWLDLNNDRLLGPTEPMAFTDSSATYSFNNLAPGTYTVRHVIISGWRQSAPAAPAEGITVTLASSGSFVSGQNFADAPSNTAGTIRGRVVFDENRNGSTDNFETGVQYQNVYVDLDNDSTVDANEPVRVTTFLGDFGIESLAAGTYKVRVAALGTFSAGTQVQSATIATNGTAAVSDFRVVATSTTGALVSGYVFNDTSADGTRQSSEPGLQDRTVWADLDNDQTIDAGEPTAVTPYGGFYVLRGLPAGSVSIRQVNPSGWSQTSPANSAARVVTLTATSTTSGVNFGSANISGTVGGQVFTDGNDNGVFDSVDTVGAGERVYVDLNNNLTFDSATEASTITTSLGDWQIDGLSPGTYTLRLLLPAGMRQTLPAAAAGITVMLAGGQTITGKNFGYTAIAPSTRIDGWLIMDFNGDGEFNMGTDGPVEGRTVYVDANKNGTFDSATERSATTSLSGVYSLTGMVGGTWDIRQVLPPGWVQTYPAANAPQTVTVALNGHVQGADFYSRALDTVAPTVSTATLSIDTSREVTFNFSEALNASTVAASDILATNLTTGATFAASGVALTNANATARFTFTDLADGMYRFRLPANSVSDVTGNRLAMSYDLAGPTVFILAGDANRDNAVTFDDLVILAQNYGKSGMTFTQGNFDYSDDHTVGFYDLVILAQQYGKSNPALATITTASTPRRRKDALAELA